MLVNKVSSLGARNKGNIVYVVAMPTRFTFRRATESDYRSQNRAINKKLLRILKNRFITLPPGCYEQSSFARELSGERIVHLKRQRYADLAEKVFRHIDADLQNAASMPSSLPIIYRNYRN